MPVPVSAGAVGARRSEVAGHEPGVVRQRGLVDVEHDRGLALVRRAALHPLVETATGAAELHRAVRCGAPLRQARVEIGLRGPSDGGKVALVHARVVVAAQWRGQVAGAHGAARADLRQAHRGGAHAGDGPARAVVGDGTAARARSEGDRPGAGDNDHRGEDQHRSRPQPGRAHARTVIQPCRAARGHGNPRRNPRICSTPPVGVPQEGNPSPEASSRELEANAGGGAR